MSLLKLFMATSQTSNNGGGGDEDANAPIILDIQSEAWDVWQGAYMFDVYMHSSVPMSELPLNYISMDVNAFDNYNGWEGIITCSYINPNEFYIKSYEEGESLYLEAEMQIDGVPTTDIELGKLYVSAVSFGTYDLEKRVIPTCVSTERLDMNTWRVGYDWQSMSMGQYLYQSNINCIPKSDDYMGGSCENCPIKKMGNIDNSEDGRYVWYNYNEEILFRDTYSDIIYALNSNGILYKYN
jgi:hypothetical protein